MNGAVAAYDLAPLVGVLAAGTLLALVPLAWSWRRQRGEAPVRRLQAFAWLQPAAGQQLEDHLYVVDPRGQWMMRVPPAADPARLKRDLDKLLAASANWDRPGR